jgi:hypothetical protein
MQTSVKKSFMKQLFFVFAALLALACNNTTKENAQADSTGTTRTGESPDKCYAYLTAKDTVRMQLVLDGKSASGDLSYRLYEKDSNTGTLNGTMQGDTLVADYTFSSEGMQSVRQVRFLKQDDMLIEGTGDMEEVNGKMVYRQPADIRYMGGLVLKKVSCDK